MTLTEKSIDCDKASNYLQVETVSNMTEIFLIYHSSKNCEDHDLTQFIDTTFSISQCESYFLSGIQYAGRTIDDTGTILKQSGNLYLFPMFGEYRL